MAWNATWASVPVTLVPHTWWRDDMPDGVLIMINDPSLTSDVWNIFVYTSLTRNGSRSTNLRQYRKYSCTILWRAGSGNCWSGGVGRSNHFPTRSGGTESLFFRFQDRVAGNFAMLPGQKVAFVLSRPIHKCYSCNITLKCSARITKSNFFIRWLWGDNTDLKISLLSFFNELKKSVPSEHVFAFQASC